MNLIICFIDDSDFEHDLVKNEIAASDRSIQFIQAYTFDEAKTALGDRIPGLFLLDLWGQDPEIQNPSITPKKELEELASGFNTLDSVFEGLDNFPGDRTNEYLKRFFSIVDSWRSLFESACSRIGQNNKYGIENIKKVRTLYPGIPAVFYTRKSLINDAVAMIKAGTEGLFIKPTGKNDAETRKLTNDFAPELILSLKKIMTSGIEGLKQFHDFYMDRDPENRGRIDQLLNYWKEFKNI